MTDPTRLREARARTFHDLLAEVGGCDHRDETMQMWQCRRWADALAAPDAAPDAPDVEAAWEALWDDLRHNAAGKRSGDAIIARHRPIIEAAIRAQGGGLDVERLALDVGLVKQAVTNIAVRHGVAKDPPPPDWSLMKFYGYTTTPAKMDAEIAAEYARLRDTPSQEKETK